MSNGSAVSSYSNCQ